MTEHRAEPDEFIAVASEFCELYETATRIGPEAFLRSLARTLPRLHSAGLALPFPDEDELPDEDVDVRPTLEERQAVDFPVEELLRQLDWSDVQERLSDPIQVGLRLYLDLSDVYDNLKEGFLLEAGRPEAEAVFEWRLKFWSHWGYHNVSALRIVHHYVALYLEG
jgi:hypothetical protein